MSIVLHGIGISGGVAIGRAYLISRSMDEVAHYLLDEKEVQSEIQRFDLAVLETRKELEALFDNIPKMAPAELGAFLSLHIALLVDPSLSLAPREIIAAQRCNAEWALKVQCEVLSAQFDQMEDGYLRERKHDIFQVAERVFKNLDGGVLQLPENEDLLEDHILIAHDFSPADMVYFKDIDFSAFITDVGGATSHTAILGRSLNLPSVMALRNARELICEGELIIVDGQQGVVIIDPDKAVLSEYRKRLRAWRDERRKLFAIRKSNTKTLDGTAIDLLANIEHPQDADTLNDSGAMGVGLFRSEFLFLGRDDLPGEEEQFEAYRHVIKTLKGQPVIIRTMDLGADKNPRWSNHTIAENPALGLTGIRLCLAEPIMFRAQLRALLRAAAEGDLHILFPMITGVLEFRQALAQLEYAREELQDEKIAHAAQVKVGAMVETPAAALIINSLLKEVDFLSVGTNDLIQYTLALDRNDSAVSYLYDPVHPAILKLLVHVIRTATKANVPVSVCGEAAGDTKLTRLLLGMGLRKFSMYRANLLAVKQQILKTDLDVIIPYTAKLLRTEDSDKIAALLQQINELT